MGRKGKPKQTRYIRSVKMLKEIWEVLIFTNVGAGRRTLIRLVKT